MEGCSFQRITDIYRFSLGIQKSVILIHNMLKGKDLLSMHSSSPEDLLWLQ